MTQRTSVSRRRAWAMLASSAVAVLAAGAARAAEISSTWSGNSGNWTDPTQWSTNPNYPNNGTPSGTTYDAVIDAPGTGPYTVTLNSNVAVDSVTLDSANATLSQTGGTLTLTSLNVSAGSYVLSGGSFQLALGAVNSGTVKATNGSTLSFFGSVDNTNGTMAVDPGSKLLLNSPSLTAGQLGAIINNGGTVALATFFDNTGNTLTFGGSSGTWILSGIVQNGVVDLPSTTITNSAQFEDVALASDLTTNAKDGDLAIQDIAVLGHHTINIFGNDASLSIGAQANTSKTLSNLTVNLGGNTSNAFGGFLYLGPMGIALTLDGTAIVNGWGGVGIENDGTGRNPMIANQGTITADIGGETLKIVPTTLTNSGILQAINGGILSIAPAGTTTWANNGILGVDSQSTIMANQNLQFASGSAFDAVLGSNGASGILSISGGLSFGSNVDLNLSLASGAVFSTPYEIISYTGSLGGAFAQVTPGYVVDYSHSGEVLITAVPEPGSCGLIVAGTLAGLTRRRRKSRGV